MWFAIGVTYYWGGEFINDDVGTNKILSNSRMGATFAMPIDKKNSIRIYGSSGIHTRYGSDFDSIAVAWQHNWAD